MTVRDENAGVTDFTDLSYIRDALARVDHNDIRPQMSF